MTQGPSTQGLGVAGLTKAAQGPTGHGRGDRYAGDPRASRSAILAANGCAATSQPLATQIAVDILKAGGSAVDAAIGANAALGLMEPTGCGIGGDLMALVWDPQSHGLHGLNGSGRAPLGQTLDQLKARLPNGATQIPLFGSAAVTVPGAVDGWCALHERFGRLPLAQVLAPAIGYAREGFPVTEIIASYWRHGMVALDRAHQQGTLEEFATAQALYLVDGQPPSVGQMFRNPALAATYERIAGDGRDGFYQGDIAQAMDSYFQRIGAPLRVVDFAAHRSSWVEPITTSYRGYDVFELPPNGQGLAALQMLNILEGFDLAAMGWGSTDALHVMIEAKKLAFEDRARFYADPAFYDRPVTGPLLSKAYAAERRALIRMDRAATAIDHGDPRLIAGDTVYLTTADRDGMMVSLIQSNYLQMGSGLAPAKSDGQPLGFMFQDRGAQFTLDATHPNAYAPGKRPFHTIIPAFVLKDGAPWLSFGVMGGAMQPQGHVQILANMIDFGLDVQTAGDVARFHHDGSTDAIWDGRMADGGIVDLETGVRADVAAALAARGHQVRLASGPHGGYQAIQWDAIHNVYRAASEFRKDGQAAGY